MRAKMSFPVPLSPWIKTGTLAPANFVRRSRTDRIPSVRPKKIASGGISPSGCTSELTVLVVMAALLTGGSHQLASRTPNRAKVKAGYPNLDYLVDGNQLTKELRSETPVIGGSSQG